MRYSLKHSILFYTCISILFFSSLIPYEAYANRGISIKPQRTALIIGNAVYKSSPLKNPIHDAEDMAEKLRTKGFRVILKTNAGQREMERSIRSFGNELQNGGIGLFFYAGHGMQVANENYLIPIGADILDETDVKYEAVNAARVLDAMNRAGNHLNIVILDACRDNPFARSFRSSRKGFARMDAPTGTIISYSTAPGKVAADGYGRNSVFTRHLLNFMDNENLTIEQIFKKVRVVVLRDTARKQIPWESSSLTGDFYFRNTTHHTGQVPSTPKVQNDNHDYDSLIQERKGLRTKWADWQKTMETHYAKAQSYEQAPELTDMEKAEIWSNFIRSYNSDNPFTGQDNKLRNDAQTQYLFWHGKSDFNIETPKKAKSNYKLAILPWNNIDEGKDRKSIDSDIIVDIVKGFDNIDITYSFYETEKLKQAMTVENAFDIQDREIKRLWAPGNDKENPTGPDTKVISRILKKSNANMALLYKKTIGVEKRETKGKP